MPPGAQDFVSSYPRSEAPFHRIRDRLSPSLSRTRSIDSLSRFHPGAFSRHRTPDILPNVGSQADGVSMLEGDTVVGEDEERKARFRTLYEQTAEKIDQLFDDNAIFRGGKPEVLDPTTARVALDAGLDATSSQPKRSGIRVIEEDDYDDDDGDTDPMDLDPSPLKDKSQLSRSSTHTLHLSPSKQNLSNSRFRKLSSSHSDPSKGLQDPRKQLELDKQARELAARQSFDTLFYTLENDRDAMLDQEKVQEADAQVDADISRINGTSEPVQEHQKLSNANLGASSLALKNLIQRIDKKRELVAASDLELRHLMSEVRKNRSKWFSEERVNQEELYEATDKVLSELKAHDQIIPFLNKVNKRDAPGYYDLIKQPMDLGTMQKKLKNLQYRSKKEVADDLSLIWSNCLRFNADSNHPLRKKAIAMRAISDKLVPLIPDLVIRDRAEVEAEERRQHAADMDLDESDEEPILSMRGRKAPSKAATKGARKSMKTPAEKPDAGIANEQSKPVPSKSQVNGRAESNPPHDRDPSSIQPSQKTPANGVFPGIGSDLLDADDSRGSVQGATAMVLTQEEPEHEDLEHRTWRIVTKKDRARVAMDRHRLFTGDKLNPDETAILRTRAGMRRWTRRHDAQSGADSEEGGNGGEASGAGATLAEGLEDQDSQESQALPDYYDVQSMIPQVPKILRWTQSANGEVELPIQYIRLAPQKLFSAPTGALQTRLDANMKQMQDTRKLVSKITMIKQMQVQQQTYANQFQKYNPQTFLDEDVPQQVTISSGPILAPNVARAALQRAVGKIFYHAGFEEFQPSAIETITEIAAAHFSRICASLLAYREGLPLAISGEGAANANPMAITPVTPGIASASLLPQSHQPRYTEEQAILHALHENTTNMRSLGAYLFDDLDRTTTKLQTMHVRMKAHLADLLRPALAPEAGADGVGAFRDGSDEFVSGDFAEEIGEDFFGFRELGLEAEFGMQGLGVPLHLLHTRVRATMLQQHAPGGLVDGAAGDGNAKSVFDLDEPDAWAKVDGRVIEKQIGLVRGWFATKMMTRVSEVRTKAEKEGGEWDGEREGAVVLVEDDELPMKQRFPKPRLPPTGKISSPRKRPIREQQAGKRKKVKLNDGAAASLNLGLGTAAGSANNGAGGLGTVGKPSAVGKGAAKGNPATVNGIGKAVEDNNQVPPQQNPSDPPEKSTDTTARTGDPHRTRQNRNKLNSTGQTCQGPLVVILILILVGDDQLCTAAAGPAAEAALVHLADQAAQV